MEYLSENLWLVWILAGVFFLIIELITTALVSIWFVAAAVVTCLVSLAVDSFLWQLVIFLLLSAVFMVIFRYVYKKYIKPGRDEIKREEMLVGRSAVTAEDTDSFGGKVLAGDVYWRAVSENGEKIPKGETVGIVKADGTTLTVRKIQK